MKKYIYLSIITAFVLLGTGVVYAEDGNDDVNDVEKMGRPELIDVRDNENNKQKDEVQKRAKLRMMENEDKLKEDNDRAKNLNDEEKGNQREIEKKQRENERELTKQQRENDREMLKQQREKAKEMVEKMKEFKQKEDGEWRLKTLLRFDAAFERTNSIISKIETRIADYKAKGVDTTNSESALAKAKSSLEEAVTKLADLKTTLDTTPVTTPDNNDDSTDVEKSDDHATLVKEVIPIAKEIQKLLISTHKSLNDSVKALRISAKDVIEKEKAEKENKNESDNTEDTAQ